MGADRKVRNSTLVQPGDRLLAFSDTPGRHTGLRVAEEHRGEVTMTVAAGIFNRPEPPPLLRKYFGPGAEGAA